MASVTSADLVIYGSANMQETDSGGQGGAINTAIKIVFTDIVGSTSVIKVSSSGSDTSQTLTVTGRNAAGSIVSEALSLNGASTITGSTAFERVLKMVLSGTCVGTVTITDDVGSPNTIATMEPGVTQVRRPFYNVSADASGGSARNYYEKVFLKNTNASNALLGASVVEASDGTEAAGANVTFDLEAAQNGANSGTDRTSAPAGGGMLGSPTFNDSSKNVPSTDLSPGSGIGIWMKLNLPAGTAATNTTFVLRASGSTT